MSPALRAVARRSFGDGRVRTISFAVFFACVAAVQVVGYRTSFPTAADRAAFARNFGDEKAVRLFYGAPHDLLTTGGYVAWRVGGVLSILAAAWGLVAAVAALRGDEEAGRHELVLAGRVTRRGNAAAVLVALGAALGVLWLAMTGALVAARLPVDGSAFLGVAALSPALVFAGVGAVAAQIAPTRRGALELGAGVLVIALALRVVADTASGAGGLRWASPLGWVEEMRAFADPRPALLVLPLLTATALVAVALALLDRRDVGGALLPARDRADADLRLLSSPTAQAFRAERGSLLAWGAGLGFFAVIVGLLADSFSSSKIPASLREQLEKAGVSIVTPAGALGFYFLFFVLVTSLFACAQVAAVRREEADGRLETLLALPVGRRSWLAGRIALAAAGIAGLALLAGVLAWAAAASQGVDVSLGRMLEAGLNCLPASLLFLGLGVLAYALAPRAAGTATYAVVAVAFLWELVGGLLEAPGWALSLSPFHEIGLVPAQPFEAGAALVMLLVGALAAALGLAVFVRRDLAAG